MFVGLLAGLLTVTIARGDVVVNIYQDGGEAVIQWGDGSGGAGSLDLTGFANGGTIGSDTNDAVFISVRRAFWALSNPWSLGPSSNSLFTSDPFWSTRTTDDFATWVKSPGSSNFGISVRLSTGSEEIYGVTGNTNNTGIMGDMRTTDISAADLMVVNNTVYTINNGAADTITFLASAPTTTSAIPEPSSALGLAGFCASFLFRRRRRLVAER